jgi:hypothetical protein
MKFTNKAKYVLHFGEILLTLNVELRLFSTSLFISLRMLHIKFNHQLFLKSIPGGVVALLAF